MTAGGGSVLVVDDESGIRAGLATALARAGHRAVVAASLGEARARLAEPTRFDCALVDIRLKDGSGLDLLREVRAGSRREVPVIVATAFDDGARVIEAMRDGAFDYLTKPFDLKRLMAAVDRAVRARRASASPLPAGDEAGAMVGRSAAMLGVWKTIGRAAGSRAPVLVKGESGVGKELAARAIHDNGASGAPLTLLRVDAETSVGSLRDAIAAVPAEATLVLDGVADLGGAAQAWLATWLATAEGPRLIALARTERVAPGGSAPAALLPELYYPLAVLEIEVPPLRDRRSDVPLLVARALGATPTRAVSEAAMAALVRHDWPGNVRELFLVVRRAAEMCHGEILDEHDLPEDLTRPAPASDPPGRFAGLPLREAVAHLERDLLADALRRAEGNRTLAAKLLGIPRPQLYAKLEEHGLEGRKAPRG
jgi:DNA-binding NtrC family response regulator